MNVQSADVKDDLQRRLRRIEGQARGVQRMIADERDCREIVQQLNAIQAAVGNTTRVLMRAYAQDCLVRRAGGESREPEVILDELFDLLAKVK